MDKAWTLDFVQIVISCPSSSSSEALCVTDVVELLCSLCVWVVWRVWVGGLEGRTILLSKEPGIFHLFVLAATLQ